MCDVDLYAYVVGDVRTTNGERVRRPGRKIATVPSCRLAPAAGQPPGARGAQPPASPCPLCVFNFRHDDQSAAYPVSISAANAGNDETSCPGSAFPFSTGTL